MPDIRQVQAIVNSIANQSLGTTGLVSTDTSFVDIGKAVLSSDENISAWYNVLIDRIGRTVLAIREYRGANAALKREPFEYGAILQKISFDIIEAKENTSWISQNNPHSDPFAKNQTKVVQSFYDKWSTWEYDSTIPDIQLVTAFKNETEMLAFIDGIFMAAYNSLELAYENLSNLTRASFAASILHSNNSNAINLLHEYNTKTNASLTVANCLFNVDFLKYATMRIKLVSDRLTRMSRLFNSKNLARHTPKQLQVINVLADFASSVTTYLQADTYHDEMVKLPLYEEVPFWQGSGTDYLFDNTAKISVQIPEAVDESSNVTGDVSYNGVIAMIYDRDACGITIDKRRTKAIYNPKDEYTNYFMKSEMGYYRDMSENGVVFYIAEA